MSRPAPPPLAAWRRESRERVRVSSSAFGGTTLARNNDREKSLAPRRARWGPLRDRSPSRPSLSLPPSGAARRWPALAQPNALHVRFPPSGDLARCSSTQVALEPFSRWAGSGGVFRCGSAPPSQRTRLDSHPRALGGLPRESSQLGSNGNSPSGAVRDLAVVDPPPFLFPASRQVRTPSELGRDAATCVAKTGAAITVGKPFRTNFAAPVFRLAASVSP